MCKSCLFFILSGLLSFGTAHAAESLETYELQQRQAGELIPVIRPMLPADSAINGQGYTLIVRGDEATHEMVRRILQKLDGKLQNLQISVRFTAPGVAHRDASGASVRLNTGNDSTGINATAGSTPRHGSTTIDIKGNDAKARKAEADGEAEYIGKTGAAYGARVRAVGMAKAAKMDKKNHRVYCLTGDGEQQEGQIWEAAMEAGAWGLDNLCCILDKNRLQIDGPVKEVMNIDPIADKYRAFGWNVTEIDGHNMQQILKAFEKAAATKDQPTVIIANTTKGKGVSFMENNPVWHGTPPSREQYEAAQTELEEGRRLAEIVLRNDDVDQDLVEAKRGLARPDEQVGERYPARTLDAGDRHLF